jgi:hypothetical protein
MSCRSIDRPRNEPNHPHHNAGETEKAGYQAENREGQADGKEPQEHAHSD